MQLNFNTFTSQLIFVPCKAISNKERIVATIASLACLIFFGGLFHLFCALRNCYINIKNKNISQIRGVEKPLTPSFIPLKNKCKTETIAQLKINEKPIALEHIKVFSQTHLPNGSEKCSFHALTNAVVAIGMGKGLFESNDFESMTTYQNLLTIFNKVFPEETENVLEIQIKKILEDLWNNKFTTDVSGLEKFSAVQKSVSDYPSTFSILNFQSEELTLNGTIGNTLHENLQEVLNFIEIHKKLNLNQPFQHAFLLAQNDPGHWVVIVLEKDLNGIVTLYGLESWNNQTYILKRLAAILCKIFDKLSNIEDAQEFIKKCYKKCMLYIETHLKNIKIIFEDDYDRESMLKSVESALIFMEKTGWCNHPEDYSKEINDLKFVIDYSVKNGFHEHPIVLQSIQKLKNLDKSVVVL